MTDGLMTLDEEASPPGTTRRPSKELAEPAFAALLARLGDEGPTPEVVYERLRKRLVAYVRLHLPAQADELADLTLDRMARRLSEGTVVQNVYLYALGIGRLVVHEARSRLAREQSSLEQAAVLGQGAANEEPDTEALLAALKACLQGIGERGAALILAYYAGGEGAARIAQRRLLAEQMHLSINALRNRALRLREMLERCVRGKLGWRDGSPLPDTSDEGSEGPGT